MRAWMVMALGIAACGTPKKLAVPRAPAIVDVSASAPRPASEPASPTCASLEREQRSSIESAIGELLKINGGEETETSRAIAEARRGLEMFGHFCFEDRVGDGEGGIWMLRAERATPESLLAPGIPLAIDWRLVHLARDGKRTSLENPLVADDGQPLKVSDMISVELDAPVIFDFDGDGESEVFLKVSGHYHESKSWTAGRIFTFKNGAVTDYAPANGLAVEEMRDVDGDGRPDLLHYGSFDAVLTGCCSGFDHRVTGPLLVVHTLPDGTFARDDQITRRELTMACAAHPGPIVDKGSEWSEGEIAVRIACARLSGIKGGAIVKALDAARGPKKDACDLETCTDRDEVRATLGSWAR